MSWIITQKQYDRWIKNMSKNKTGTSWIYNGGCKWKLFKDDEITPSKEFFDELSPRGKNALLKGKPTVYDKNLDIFVKNINKLI